MIGLVWTSPGLRGQGHASALLQYAQEQLQHEERDFAVLWTTKPGVYSSQGWFSSDKGRYGIALGTPGACPEEHLEQQSFARIEAIRHAYLRGLVHRESDLDLSLPMPATRLATFIENNAYAIVGLAANDMYIVDIAGASEDYSRLWSRIIATGKRIHVNTCRNSSLERWIRETNALDLEDKVLAMWLPLSPSARNLDYSTIYIPVVDRL